MSSEGLGVVFAYFAGLLGKVFGYGLERLQLRKATLIDNINQPLVPLLRFVMFPPLHAEPGFGILGQVFTDYRYLIDGRSIPHASLLSFLADKIGRVLLRGDNVGGLCESYGIFPPIGSPQGTKAVEASRRSTDAQND